MEIWKDIKGFEGYQVSNIGRVRTHNKITYTKLHGKRKWKDRILCYKHENYSSKNRKQGVGYRVDLWKDGKPHTFLVHRLVATTFLEDFIDTNMTVNHKDGNRYNNNVENLEWLTLADNIRYGFDNKQFPQKFIKITNTMTGDKQIFRSMSQASKYFHKFEGFISQRLKKQQNTFVSNGCTYIIEVVA